MQSVARAARGRVDDVDAGLFHHDLHAARRGWLSDFRHQDLGQHDGGGRGHDHGRQQMPDLDVRHQYIRGHDGARDVRHAAHHDGEQLGLGQAFAETAGW